MRAKDWSATPLGPPEGWPRPVKTAVSLCLNSRFPILLWLGPELRIVYNDAYVPFLGPAKHPAMLGAPGREAWGEIWPAIGPMLDEALAGRATWVEDFRMFFARRLPREEVYVTFSYGPILGDDGRTVEGVFCACAETTGRVLGERRLSTLRDLGLRTSGSHTVEAACRAAAEVLDANPLDVPFAAVYLPGGDGNARLVAGTRLPDHRAAFPEVHDAARGPWPLAEAARTRRTVEVPDLPDRVGAFPGPLWPDLVGTAFVVPLAAPSQPAPAGFLVVGASPRRVLDADYRSFLDLVAEHVAAAIADARAHEEERRRAEALAEVDRAKTAFFSNVSHEFRTPLTLMLGPAGRAAGQVRGPAARATLGPSRRWPTATACACCGSSTRCSTSRASRPAGPRRPTSRPTSRRSPRSWPRASARPASARACDLAVDCPPLPRAGLRRPRDVGEGRPQPALQRVQVHASRAGSRSRFAPRTAAGRPS